MTNQKSKIQMFYSSFADCTKSRFYSRNRPNMDFCSEEETPPSPLITWSPVSCNNSHSVANTPTINEDTGDLLSLDNYTPNLPSTDCAQSNDEDLHDLLSLHFVHDLQSDENSLDSIRADGIEHASNSICDIPDTTINDQFHEFEQMKMDTPKTCLDMTSSPPEFIPSPVVVDDSLAVENSDVCKFEGENTDASSFDRISECPTLKHCRSDEEERVKSSGNENDCFFLEHENEYYLDDILVDLIHISYRNLSTRSAVNNESNGIEPFNDLANVEPKNAIVCKFDDELQPEEAETNGVEVFANNGIDIPLKLIVQDTEKMDEVNSLQVIQKQIATTSSLIEVSSTSNKSVYDDDDDGTQSANEEKNSIRDVSEDGKDDINENCNRQHNTNLIDGDNLVQPLDNENFFDQQLDEVAFESENMINVPSLKESESAVENNPLIQILPGDRIHTNKSNTELVESNDIELSKNQCPNVLLVDNKIFEFSGDINGEFDNLTSVSTAAQNGLITTPITKAEDSALEYSSFSNSELLNQDDCFDSCFKIESPDYGPITPVLRNSDTGEHITVMKCAEISNSDAECSSPNFSNANMTVVSATVTAESSDFDGFGDFEEFDNDNHQDEFNDFAEFQDNENTNIEFNTSSKVSINETQKRNDHPPFNFNEIFLLESISLDSIEDNFDTEAMAFDIYKLIPDLHIPVDRDLNMPFLTRLSTELNHYLTKEWFDNVSEEIVDNLEEGLSLRLASQALSCKVTDAILSYALFTADSTPAHLCNKAIEENDYSAIVKHLQQLQQQILTQKTTDAMLKIAEDAALTAQAALAESVDQATVQSNTSSGNSNNRLSRSGSLFSSFTSSGSTQSKKRLQLKSDCVANTMRILTPKGTYSRHRMQSFSEFTGEDLGNLKCGNDIAIDSISCGSNEAEKDSDKDSDITTTSALNLNREPTEDHLRNSFSADAVISDSSTVMSEKELGRGWHSDGDDHVSDDELTSRKNKRKQSWKKSISRWSYISFTPQSRKLGGNSGITVLLLRQSDDKIDGPVKEFKLNLDEINGGFDEVKWKCATAVYGLENILHIAPSQIQFYDDAGVVLIYQNDNQVFGQLFKTKVVWTVDITSKS